LAGLRPEKSNRDKRRKEKEKEAASGRILEDIPLSFEKKKVEQRKPVSRWPDAIWKA